MEENPKTGKKTQKPDWLRVKLPTGNNYRFLKHLVQSQNLNTVCEEARCPNISECWGKYRTASFMILGDVCTRRCRFCAVKTGLPSEVDLNEPQRIADSVMKMDLQHVHITMVNRDDLIDGGASVMAETVRNIREKTQECTVEVLCSDFEGRYESISEVVSTEPDIFSHNLETVRRLTPVIRSNADYDRSLVVLETAKEINPVQITKSSIMLGLGETVEEIEEVMDDLRALDVDIINIGQYLQPTKGHAAVKKFWHPDEFAELKDLADRKGFLHCESGPLVRSSYHADDQYQAYLHQKTESIES